MENKDAKQILDAISQLSDKTDKRFDAVIKDIHDLRKDSHDLRKDSHDLITTMAQFAQNVEDRFNGIDNRLDGVDSKFEGIIPRLNRLESLMVTKDYLDDKLADLRSDLGLPIRQTNIKVHTLTDELADKKVFNNTKAKEIKSLPPFPMAL